MGVQDNNRWQNALDYTPVLLAIIKVVRIIILYHVYTKWQAKIRTIIEEKGINKANARQFSISIFART